MSSIIASSLPPAAPSTCATGRGVLSSSLIPIAWARRRAGSMVSTTTWRPRSAARRASAAEVVVLPTPPEPQHTMMPVPGSSSSASTSSRGAVRRPGPAVDPRPEGPTRVRAFTATPVPADRGQLVERAQVDALGQPGQLVRRHSQLGDERPLGVLQRAPLGVLARLVRPGCRPASRCARSRPGSGPRRWPRGPGRRRGPAARSSAERSCGRTRLTTTAADRQVGGAQLGDPVGGLLDRHLLQHRDQVHRRARGAEERHHRVGLALIGPTLASPASSLLTFMNCTIRPVGGASSTTASYWIAPLLRALRSTAS